MEQDLFSLLIEDKRSQPKTVTLLQINAEDIFHLDFQHLLITLTLIATNLYDHNIDEKCSKQSIAA